MSQDWHFGKKLGEGANGAAFLAFRRDYLTEKPDPSETFVIKKVPLGKEPVTSKSAKLRETQLLAMIRHPYIVTYEDCFQSAALVRSGVRHYMCISISVCVYLYVCLCTYLHICICIHTHTHTHTHTCK